MTTISPRICRCRGALALALALTTLQAAPAASAPDDPVKERGRAYCRLFYDGELGEIWRHFSPDMRDLFGTVDSLKAFRAHTLGFLGSEVTVIEETTGSADNLTTYRRIARFENTSQLARIEWTFDPEWTVTGFLIWANEGEAPSTHLGYETKTSLRLPFNEEWFVLWGGRTVAVNYHAETMDQRFACDLLIMKDGSTHRGEGRKNEDYYVF